MCLSHIRNVQDELHPGSILQRIPLVNLAFEVELRRLANFGGFRLSELAASLAVSERTLNRRFKEAVGLAPLTYLQNLRIEVAKRLLETRPIGLEAVSQRVGYGDISTFRQLFKRKTELSPSEYQMRFSRATAVNAEGELRRSRG
ncbi:helix-turn-helix domain-containing protein [Paraburkholderia phymatum]|uniref:Helix-turn-helix domain-containing protein n=1 Tax=Paraburkholderia phymatum TaxID=148447 RepID=A0ACC6UE74_9BURK